jgi:hypothetical protein
MHATEASRCASQKLSHELQARSLRFGPRGRSGSCKSALPWMLLRSEVWCGETAKVPNESFAQNPGSHMRYNMPASHTRLVERCPEQEQHSSHCSNIFLLWCLVVRRLTLLLSRCSSSRLTNRQTPNSSTSSIDSFFHSCPDRAKRRRRRLPQFPQVQEALPSSGSPGKRDVTSGDVSVVIP